MPGNIIQTIVAHWPKIALAFALVGVGAASAKTVKTVQEFPVLQAKHDSSLSALRNDMLPEMREQTKLQRQSLCLQVALLRHSDWTVCLLP